jgi:hypothetical protein
MLRTVIAEQFLKKKFTGEESIKKIFEYFNYVDDINGIGHPLHFVVHRDNVDESLANETKDYLALTILERCGNSPKHHALLDEIRDHYNGSHPIFQRIEEIISK